MLQVPPDEELVVLRARVAELEAQLAGRDVRLEAAQAQIAVLAGQVEELRRRLGKDSSTSSKPPSSDSPYTKKPKDRSLRRRYGRGRGSSRVPRPRRCGNHPILMSGWSAGRRRAGPAGRT
jgi:hypothetical protein